MIRDIKLFIEGKEYLEGRDFEIKPSGLQGPFPTLVLKEPISINGKTEFRVEGFNSQIDDFRSISVSFPIPKNLRSSEAVPGDRINLDHLIKPDTSGITKGGQK